MKEEVHHINLDPSDNTPGNLIKIDAAVHDELHKQLAYLIKGWKIPLNRKDFRYRILIKHLLKTGEMKFDRERRTYYISPKEGCLLSDYEKDLHRLRIFPPHIPPSMEEQAHQAMARFKLKMRFMERFSNEALP